MFTRQNPFGNQGTSGSFLSNPVDFFSVNNTSKIFGRQTTSKPAKVEEEDVSPVKPRTKITKEGVTIKTERQVSKKDISRQISTTKRKDDFYGQGHDQIEEEEKIQFKPQNLSSSRIANVDVKGMVKSLINEIQSGKTVMELSRDYLGDQDYWPVILTNYNELRGVEETTLYHRTLTTLQKDMKKAEKQGLTAEDVIATAIFKRLTDKNDKGAHYEGTYMAMDFIPLLYALTNKKADADKKSDAYFELEDKEEEDLKDEINRLDALGKKVESEGWVDEGVRLLSAAKALDVGSIMTSLRKMEFCWPEFCLMLRPLENTNEYQFWVFVQRFTMMQWILERIMNPDVDEDGSISDGFQIDDLTALCQATYRTKIPKAWKFILERSLPALNEAWITYAQKHNLL